MSTVVELLQLIEHDIPEGRRHLQDSHTNLEKVAAYCEGNYLQSQDKRHALEETKSYTTQSLASVAYQINTLATNFLHLLDLHNNQLKDMESSVNHLSQTVMIHKEKVARREIGVLTTNKTTTRPQGVKNPGIIFPEQPERPIKYLRKPIDYSVLDDIGHGVKQVAQSNPRSRRTSSGSSKSSLGSAGQAPTTKPPTPPAMMRGGTLTRQTSSPYRTPAPPVSPPSVPSHYAPGHYQKSQTEAREAERRSGYAAIGNIQMIPVLPSMQNGYSGGLSRPTTQPPPPPTKHHQSHQHSQQQSPQRGTQQSQRKPPHQTSPVSPGFRGVGRPTTCPPPPPSHPLTLQHRQHQVVQVLPTLHNGYGPPITRSLALSSQGVAREPQPQQVAQVPPTLPGGYGPGMQQKQPPPPQQQAQQHHQQQQQTSRSHMQPPPPTSRSTSRPQGALPMTMTQTVAPSAGPTIQQGPENFEPLPPPQPDLYTGTRMGNISPPLPSPPLPPPPPPTMGLNITVTQNQYSHPRVHVANRQPDHRLSPPPPPSPIQNNIPFADDDVMMDTADNLSPPLPPPPEHGGEQGVPLSHFDDQYGNQMAPPPVNFAQQGPPSHHLPGQRRGPPYAYRDDDDGPGDDNQSDWIPKSYISKGLHDWVPKNYLRKVVAIYDYIKDKEDELSFQESAIIYVIKQNDDGWWEGVMDGVTGLFPGNYVEPM